METVNWSGLVIVSVFILADIVMGIARAFVQGDFASLELKRGLVHKAVYYLFIILALTIEVGAQYYPPIAELAQLPIYDTVCVGICAIELSSIIENATAMFPELKDAPFLKHFTSKVKEG